MSNHFDIIFSIPDENTAKTSRVEFLKTRPVVGLHNCKLLPVELMESFWDGWMELDGGGCVMSFYAVVYTDHYGFLRVVNLGANGAYENSSITNDIRHAVEIANYMTKSVGNIGYKVMRVRLEDIYEEYT